MIISEHVDSQPEDSVKYFILTVSHRDSEREHSHTTMLEAMLFVLTRCCQHTLLPGGHREIDRCRSAWLNCTCVRARI